ncbi:restriction endonuclease subunit S [Methanococcus voltae]|uniref:Type I restriction enzyme S subunit n=2 Tax=Methanococcus voltae TaxID=2188 RepID=A0A8J7RNQ1_METVO|nr:restriction endonuclease subunit S [Methanococcus voltae]MBP2173219.1 type I restriction enzyme S subunit [Methanococcus voltae]MBP2202266.1 type I restriction enzyme S subunit [Methanococcus voltae]MCS3922949.1 type I restriction enzyme S subunit [Methanococcus voltae PS]
MVTIFKNSPGEWGIKKLGEIAKIQTGKLDVNAENINGKYPFFTCSKEIHKINTWGYDCECVIVAGNADLNIKYYNGKFNAYQRTYIIEIVNKRIVETKYLYYFLSAYVNILRKKSTGGVIKYIRLVDLTDIDLPIPPLNIQRQIVKVLENIEIGINLREKAILETENLIKSVFLDTFGNPLDNPKDWDIKEIKKTCLKISNIIPNKSLSDEYINYIDISSIDNKSKKIVNVKKIKGEDAPIRARQKVLKDDILVAIVRPNLNSVALVSKEYNNMVVSTGFCVLRPNKDIINEKYLFEISKSDYFISNLVSKCKGANYPAVNKPDVLGLEIPVPPLDFQNKFAEIVQKLEEIKEKQIKSKEEMNELFDCCLYNTFMSELVK